jgi:hypothetical protein
MTAVFVVPFTVAAYCAEVPDVTVVTPLKANVTEGAFGGSRVTRRLCATPGSSLLVAVIVTFGDWGAVAGAVYIPFVEMEPRVRLPPTTPLTLHVTLVSELPVTVAEYRDDMPSVTLIAPLRVSVTVRGGGGGVVRVTARLSATDESAALVAVIVTCDDLGFVAGAV